MADAPKVLLVDDDADLRHAICILLRTSCRVFEADHGKEALRIIRKERPRLMLLDLSMPGMDGLEVLEAARNIDPEIIVIMLSSRTELNTAKRTLDLGANQYITKPFDVDYLRNEVRRLLGIAGRQGSDKNGRPWRIVS